MAAPARGRRRALLVAGLVDSLGLAVGWTAMSLQAVQVQGLHALGLLSAAMLVGVALSAPLTGWLAARMDGRRLLQATAVGEGVLRTITFLLLFSGAPLVAVAGLVTFSNVLAWTGFAGMRAEMSLLGGGARWLAAYTAMLAAAEALGAFVAAFLPLGPDRLLLPSVAAVVAVAYGASLIPTWFVARGARVARATSGRLRSSLEGRGRVLLGGAAITLLATGPTLLAVGLADALHGRGAVGPAMLLFAIGSLLGPLLAGWVGRLVVPVGVVWGFLGVLMLGGWGLAPISVAGLLLAQLVSGLALGAFEGVMDAAVCRTGRRGTETGGLAWAGATRALGSAAAVSAVPIALAGVGLGRTAAVGTIVLVAGTVMAALTAVGGGASALRSPRVSRPGRRPPGSGLLARGLPRRPATPGQAVWFPERWALLVAGDEADRADLAARSVGVSVVEVTGAAALPEVVARDGRPDLVVLGSAAVEADVRAVEALVAGDGPWAESFVRVVDRPGRARPLRLVDAA